MSDELARLRELSEKATPGDMTFCWATRGDEADGRIYQSKPNYLGQHYPMAISPRYQTKQQWEYDAAFIVACVNYVRAALAVSAGVEAKPVAWARFAENGNVREWRPTKPGADEIHAHEYGPIYRVASPSPAPEAEKMAAMIESMLDDYVGKPDARMALAIAAKNARRGRVLAETEKLENLRKAMAEAAAELAVGALTDPQGGEA